MGAILFIMWRESIEAVLVIGILYAYLKRFPDARRSFRYLWAGVAGGLVLSGLVALATLGIQSELAGRSLEWFQTGMLFAAALLLTQMVLWMSKHGREFKANLEAGLGRALGAGRLVEVSLVALLAVAREGSEAVLYIYGLGMEAGAHSPLSLYAAAIAGLVLALITAWAAAKGIRYLNYKIFFRVTTVLLLFSAAGLLVSGISSLIGMGLLPAGLDPVWNSTALLDSSSQVGGIVASLTGYRSKPSLTLLLAYILYWAVVIAWLKRPAARKTVTQPTAA